METNMDIKKTDDLSRMGSWKRSAFPLSSCKYTKKSGYYL